MGEDVEKLKQRLPLIDYLRQQNWTGRPGGAGSEFVGLCPLHEATRPSFYVNARKNLFYCHGCGQGGDLLRFIQLSRHLSFRESLAYLEQLSAPPADAATVLEQAATFYQQQLDCYPEAVDYLKQRGLLDETLVVWGGEFGRTPMVEMRRPNDADNAGRDHHPNAFTMWMAGGGVKGGVSIGQTDELGSMAVENRYQVKHLHATILALMGFDPNHLSFFYGGLDQRLVGVEGADPITEIMTGLT